MAAENVQVEVPAVEAPAVEEVPPKVEEAPKVEENKEEAKVETFGVEPADAEEKKEEKCLSTRKGGLFGFCLACGKGEAAQEVAEEAKKEEAPQEGEAEKENIAVGVPAAEVVATEAPVETPAPAAEE